MTEELEPKIMIEKVEKAIACLKNNKAPGPSDVTAEFLETSNKELAQYKMYPVLTAFQLMRGIYNEEKPWKVNILKMSGVVIGGCRLIIINLSYANNTTLVTSKA